MCASFSNNADVTLRRNGEKWQITSLSCDFPLDMADPMFRRIGRLTTLENLRLGWLSESGTPDRLSWQRMRELAHLQELRALRLPWDRIDSDLEFLCAFTKLERLDFSFIRLSGSPSIASIDHLKGLRHLEELNFDSSGLDDESLDRVTALSGLEDLTLTASKTTDATVAKLKALRNLRCLAIDNLGPRGLAAMRELPHLEHLRIEDYKPAPDSADLSVLTGLKWLTIDELPDEQSVRVRLPASLRRLDVQNHRLGTLDFQLSANIEHVQLDLATTRSIFDPHRRVAIDAAWLASLPKLREMKLIDPIAQDVKSIAGLESLQALTLKTLEYLGVEDEGMRMLAPLRQLESLSVIDECDGNVGSKPISEGLDVLPKLPKLRRLVLIGFPVVTSKGLANVWKLTQLRALRLDLQRGSSALMNDGALAHIGAMSDLEELSIGASGGTVTDKGIKSLANLKKLRRLDLSAIDGYSDDALASLMNALPNLKEVKRTYRPLTNQARD